MLSDFSWLSIVSILRMYEIQNTKYELVFCTYAKSKYKIPALHRPRLQKKEIIGIILNWTRMTFS